MNCQHKLSKLRNPLQFSTIHPMITLGTLSELQIAKLLTATESYRVESAANEATMFIYWQHEHERMTVTKLFYMQCAYINSPMLIQEQGRFRPRQGAKGNERTSFRSRKWKKHKTSIACRINPNAIECLRLFVGLYNLLCV